MATGIYTITNLVNNKMYVGYASNIQKRKSQHWEGFRKGNHKNPHLRSAVKHYGIENFKFELLEEWPDEHLCTMEHWWCLMLNTHNREYGYNEKPTHPHGLSKMSLSTRNKLSISATGRKHSAETLKKLSDRKKGRKQSAEYIESRICKIRGVPQSEETKRKRSIAMMGNKNGKHTSKPIIQYDMTGTYIKEWSGMIMIREQLGYSTTTMSNACNNKIKVKGRLSNQYKNYLWQFKN